MLLIACATVVALVAVATAIGLVGRARSGRTRAMQGETVDVASLGTASALGDRVTFVQFSTAFCAPCKPTARLLEEVAEAVPGAAHIEVRVDEQPHLADRFGVLQAPTTLVLDRRGAIRARVVGIPRREQLQLTVADLLEEPRAHR